MELAPHFDQHWMEISIATRSLQKEKVNENYYISIGKLNRAFGALILDNRYFICLFRIFSKRHPLPVLKHHPLAIQFSINQLFALNLRILLYYLSVNHFIDFL